MGTALKFTIFAILFLFGILSTGRAEAYDNGYCRDYTRTVYIGNSVQEAQGTACLQDNGDWVIVGEGLTGDIPANVNDVQYIIHDRPRDVIPSQVIYYDTYPRYSTVTPIYIWQRNGYYRGRDYYAFNRKIYHNPRPAYRHDWSDHRRYDRYNRHDRHDRHDRYDRRDWHDARSYGRVENRGNRRWDSGQNSRGGYDPTASNVSRGR